MEEAQKQPLMQWLKQETRLEIKLLALLMFYLPIAFCPLGVLYNKVIGISYQGRLDRINPGLVLLVPSLVVGVSLILARNGQYPRAVSRHPFRLLSEFAFSVWVVGATLSCIVHWDEHRTPSNYITTFFMLPFLYQGTRDLKLSRRDIHLLFSVLCISSCLLFTIALAYYFKAFGIPSFGELILSRYRLDKMASYRDWTFGNTGNTAAFLMLTMHPILLLYFTKDKPLAIKRLYGFTFFLMFIHFVIIQSRVTYLVTLAITPALLYVISRTTKQFVASTLLLVTLVGSLGAVLYFTSGAELLDLLDRFQNGVAANQGEDDSVRGRIFSMVQGRRIFETHWELGIGQGNAPYYIRETAVHQFNLNQATELGIMGLIASILIAVGTVGRGISLLIICKRSEAGQYRLIFILGPFCYIVYGVIGNMPLSADITNTWLSLFIIFTTLSDFILQKEEKEEATPDPIFIGSPPPLLGDEA